MNLDNAIAKVSAELNLPEELVRSVYREYWKYIRSVVENLPLKDGLNEKEFSTLRTNINIPSLGKMGCTHQRYLEIKSRFNTINKQKNEH